MTVTALTGQSKVFGDGLVIKQTAALEDHADAKALAKLFAFIEPINVAAENEMCSGAWALQGGGGGEEIGLAGAGQTADYPIIAGVDGPVDVLNHHSVGAQLGAGDIDVDQFNRWNGLAHLRINVDAENGTAAADQVAE